MPRWRPAQMIDLPGTRYRFLNRDSVYSDCEAVLIFLDMASSRGNPYLHINE